MTARTRWGAATILTVVSMILTLMPAAQAITVGQAKLGTELRDVAAMPDGSSAVAGFVTTKDGHRASVVARIGVKSDVKWQRTWRPGSGCAASADAVAVSDTGFVYVAGSFGCDEDGGSQSWFLRRYTGAGELLWAVTQPADLHPEIWGLVDALAAREGGGVIMAGRDEGCCDVTTPQDGWVRAFDANGHLLWTNRFEAPGIATATHDQVNDVSTSGDAIYVTGFIAQGTATEPWRDLEIAIGRLTSQGRWAWFHLIRDAGAPAGDLDMGTAITMAAGRPVAVFQVQSGATTVHRIEWYSTTGTRLRSRPTSLFAQTLAGNPRGELYTAYGQRLVKFAPDGSVLWKSGFGPTYELSAVAASGSAGLAAGYVRVNDATHAGVFLHQAG
jgi:hypothetical protein